MKNKVRLAAQAVKSLETLQKANAAIGEAILKAAKNGVFDQSELNVGKLAEGVNEIVVRKDMVKVFQTVHQATRNLLITSRKIETSCFHNSQSASDH